MFDPSLSRVVADAATVFRLLAADVGPVGVVALVIGADHETIDLCICDDDDAVEERARLLLELYAGDAIAVVFATIRAGDGSFTPSPAEALRAARLRDHGNAVGLPVLDWHYVGASA
jgi:hypothetical protein